MPTTQTTNAGAEVAAPAYGRVVPVFGPLAVLALTVLAAALCIHGLAAKSIWTDEGVSIAFARLDWYNFLRILWRRELNMVLYYLLLRGWMHLGDSVAWIRALSVVPAVAAVPAIYALGRRLFGTAVGLMAALLLAINAYQVRYAQEARSYSLVVLLLVLSSYFLVRAVESADRRDWKWYVAASALAVYAHFYAVLVMVAHAVALRCVPPLRGFGARTDADPGLPPWANANAAPAGLDPRQADANGSGQLVGEARGRPSALGRKNLLIPSPGGAWQEFKRAAKWIALWTAPVWVFIATTGAGPIRWIHRPGAGDVYEFFDHLTGNGGPVLFWLYAACVALAAIAVVQALRREARTGKSQNPHLSENRARVGPPPQSHHSQQSWRYALLFSWLIVPLGIVLVVSALRPVFLARYMIVCLPALVLLAAMGLNSFRQRWMALPVLALIVWFAVVGVRSYYQRDFDLDREDFKGVTAYILERAQPGDAVLFYKGQARFPYSYYAAHLPARAKPMIVAPGHGDTPQWRDFMGKASPELLHSLTRDYSRVWLVLSQNMDPAGEDQGSRDIRAAVGERYHVIDQQDFPCIRVYLYAP